MGSNLFESCPTSNITNPTVSKNPPKSHLRFGRVAQRFRGESLRKDDESSLHTADGSFSCMFEDPVS